MKIAVIGTGMVGSNLANTFMVSLRLVGEHRHAAAAAVNATFIMRYAHGFTALWYYCTYMQSIDKQYGYVEYVQSQ